MEQKMAISPGDKATPQHRVCGATEQHNPTLSDACNVVILLSYLGFSICATHVRAGKLGLGMMSV